MCRVFVLAACLLAGASANTAMLSNFPNMMLKELPQEMPTIADASMYGNPEIEFGQPEQEIANEDAHPPTVGTIEYDEVPEDDEAGDEQEEWENYDDDGGNADDHTRLLWCLSSVRKGFQPALHHDLVHRLGLDNRVVLCSCKRPRTICSSNHLDRANRT